VRGGAEDRDPSQVTERRLITVEAQSSPAGVGRPAAVAAGGPAGYWRGRGRGGERLVIIVTSGGIREGLAGFSGSLAGAREGSAAGPAGSWARRPGPSRPGSGGAPGPSSSRSKKFSRGLVWDRLPEGTDADLRAARGRVAGGGPPGGRGGSGRADFAPIRFDGVVFGS
jgi:hypothetical protein